jgi:hypothetical protein
MATPNCNLSTWEVEREDCKLRASLGNITEQYRLHTKTVLKKKTINAAVTRF